MSSRGKYKTQRTQTERFEEKVMPVTETGCFLWTAHCNKNGYGTFWTGEKDEYAHRVAWKLYRGNIPKGLCVCHKCDTPSCVSPDHLFIGTRKDNQQDAFQKGRLKLDGLYKYHEHMKKYGTHGKQCPRCGIYINKYGCKQCK